MRFIVIQVLGYKSLLDMSALQRWRMDQQLKKSLKAPGLTASMGSDIPDRNRTSAYSANNSAASSFAQSYRDSTVGDRGESL